MSKEKIMTMTVGSGFSVLSGFVGSLPQTFSQGGTTLYKGRNTVKSFCRRHSLAASTAGAVCEQCGKPIEQNPGRKRKRFCCDVCRNKWWNAHLELVKRKAVYTYTCPACGKKFTVYGNSHRKFCSHACYIAYRFGGVRHG